MSAVATPMIAVSKDAVAKGQVKPLGFISWYTVPDLTVSLRRLKRTWAGAGLDSSPLPKDRKAKDTFRLAMREQAGKVRLDDGTVIETDVVEVVETAEEVVYQVSRVVRDAQERVVDYPKGLRVIFNKATFDVTFNSLKEVPSGQMFPLMEAITDYIEQNSKMVTGAQVRSLVRNYLRNDYDERAGQVGLSGENMRGKAGGVYFVLAKHEDELENLSECLAKLYPGRAYLYTVPMADGASERELIRRQHAANTVEDIKAEIEEVRHLLRDDRDRGIRSNVAEHHWLKLKQLRRRAAEYSKVLKEETDEIGTMSDMLHKQLTQLI